MFTESLSGPSTPKASAASLLVQLLRLFPAGAKAAGWDSHPQKDRAFARRTNPLIFGQHTPVGLHYTDVAVAACAAVIFGGGCAGRDSFSRSSSSCNSGSGWV